MDFTTTPYAVFASSSEGWNEYRTLAPATCSEQEIFNFALPSSTTTSLSPTTFPAPASSLLSIPSANQTVVSGPPHKKAKRFTSRGQPKPNEKELDPEEDVPTTAPNAVVSCRWGKCTERFCAGVWTAHAKKHRQEMLRDRDGTGHVRCRWNGCKARLLPDNMGKHVRAQHVGTYEIRCKYCGKTARADSYLAAHGLARDCPMRPAPSRASSMPVTTSVATTPALSPSGSSTRSCSPSLDSSHRRYVNMSAGFPEESEGWLPPVLRLLAKSLRHRQRRLDHENAPALPAAGPPNALQATIAQPLVLANPRPEPPLKPLEFTQFMPPSLVPSLPTIPGTPIDSDLGGHSSPLADSEPFDHCRPFALAADWGPPASDSDVSLCLLVAGIADFDASFVFNPDATS